MQAIQLSTKSRQVSTYEYGVDPMPDRDLNDVKFSKFADVKLSMQSHSAAG